MSTLRLDDRSVRRLDDWTIGRRDKRNRTIGSMDYTQIALHTKTSLIFQRSTSTCNVELLVPKRTFKGSFESFFVLNGELRKDKACYSSDARKKEGKKK